MPEGASGHELGVFQISSQSAECTDFQGRATAPLHPQTQGQIEHSQLQLCPPAVASPAPRGRHFPTPVMGSPMLQASPYHRHLGAR